MALSLRKKIIVLQFWSWYYTGAVRSLIKTWRGFIIFVREYYSIPLLLKTLFCPWRRDITKYGRGFSIKNFLETLSFNLISRSLGFFARTFIIILGSICLLGVIILGALALIVWLILPFVLLIFIAAGFFLWIG